MFDNSEKSFDSSLPGLGNSSTYLDKDPLNPNPTELGSQQLPPVNAPLDYAGNTRATARNVGTLTGSQSFNDWVGISDTNDYYSFNVGTQSNLSLNLTGLTANADVQLLNSSGGVITTSAKTATTSESIASLLSAGAYFVRVYRSSGDTNYSLSLNATPVDSAGNTLVAARNVGALTGTQSFSDWVGSVDTNDYYSFNVGTQSNFSLSLTGLTANADVELLDSSGGVITTSANTDTTSESITSLLGIGTYYARVYQFSGDTNYSLSLNATPVDNAGNTRATARKVETLTGSQSFSDWVGSVDTNDYYSFNVGTQSNFSLNLTGLTANADVQLLNSSGGVITTSAKTATTSESITSLLNAGSYFVRVYRSSGNTNYSLSLTVDNAGNTLAKARNVGTLTATQSFNDWVGSSDTNDYYSFNVGTQSNFSLNLTGLTADADVALFNSSGTVISGSYTDGIVSESITSLLSAGAYYVRVFQYSGDTNYSLSLNAAALPVDNAGNTLAKARNVGTLTATQSFSDWIGTADTNDYYSFNVGTQSNFSLNLTGLTADADVELFNSSGTVISGSYTDGIVSESIASLLSAGAYYVRVFQYSGDTNYSLSLNAIALPVDNAGNTLPTARNVGTLTATQSFSDWIGTADTNDYYNFNVGTQSNFSLNLTGLTADADVELFNSSGTVISYSYTDGIVSESIASLLSAGAYYVRVFQYSGDTNYSLSLNATAVAPTPTPTPTPIPTDWYSQNLLDAQIITLTRSLAADGNLSRNDMISIFRDAKDGSVIDANELTDLRTLVSNSTLFTMVDYVKVLSNKIANGNAANIRSGFGNLFADSSDTQMENLIGKWFLGTDRPDTGYTYSYASGSLFQNGASADDIYQGAVGDCYYVATLASIAQEKPEYIQNMFTDNGDNTFTVRFYNNGVADYVTVDRYLPTYSSGNAAYAGWGGGSSTSTSNELWVALAEKAYAQLAESGWSRTYSGTQNNSYAAIEGGWMDTVIRQVTGLSATSQSVSNMTQTQLINLVNSNQVLTAGFVYGAGYGVVDGHAYTITAYNATNGTFHLRNPWGSYHADVTWSQLLSLRAILQWSNT